MARPLRIQAPGLTYHVTARGVRRTSIFLDDDDRRRFLALLAAVIERYALRCHAYCQMTNHYHLALTTEDANLSRAIQQLNGDYAQWWNWRHERRGHVFQARFDAQVVQHERYLFNVCRYIVMNPVRAGMVDRPEQWPWSSYRAMITRSGAPAFLDCDHLWQIVAPDDPSAGPARFREALAALDAVDEPVSSAAILGDEEFVARLQPFRDRASREVPRRHGRRTLDTIFQSAITREARNRAVVTAYRERFTLAEIARHISLHPSTVTRILAAVPDREKC